MKKTIPRLLQSNKKKKGREDREERKFYFAMMYMCTSILLLVYQEMSWLGVKYVFSSEGDAAMLFDREVNLSVPCYLESFVI